MVLLNRDEQQQRGTYFEQTEYQQGQKDDSGNHSQSDDPYSNFAFGFNQYWVDNSVQLKNNEFENF